MKVAAPPKGGDSRFTLIILLVADF